MNKLFLGLVASAAFVSTAGAQKGSRPPPPPASANPEIGYVDARPRYPEVRLANEDLTGSFLVYRSQVEYAMPRYDLSPRGQNQVAVTSAGNAYLVTWSHSGSAVSLTTEPLTAASTGASEIVFSHDRTKVAVNYQSDNTIRIFDVSTRSQIKSWPAPSVYKMTWLRSGDAIALIDPVQWRALKQISLIDGTVSSQPFPAGELRHLDAAHGSDAILTTYLVDGSAPTSHYFGRWNGGVLSPERIRQGFDANYNCDDTRVVYKTTGPRSSTYVHNLSSNTDNVMTKNEDVRRVSYVPTC